MYFILGVTKDAPVSRKSKGKVPMCCASKKGTVNFSSTMNDLHKDIAQRDNDATILLSQQTGEQPIPKDNDPQCEGDRRCPFCFISPCVGYSNRAARWIGFGQAESEQNPGIRKRIFK